MTFPKVVKVRQEFPRPRVEDVEAAIFAMGGRTLISVSAAVRKATGLCSAAPVPADLIESQVLDHLHGYEGAKPVRVGNGAWNQTQLDVFGELISAIHRYRERLGDLHPEIQAFVADLADTAARRWHETDSGIWEMRGEPRHHLSSKVMCWVALDRGIRLAHEYDVEAPLAQWKSARDEISTWRT